MKIYYIKLKNREFDSIAEIKKEYPKCKKCGKELDINEKRLRCDECDMEVPIEVQEKDSIVEIEKDEMIEIQKIHTGYGTAYSIEKDLSEKEKCEIEERIEEMEEAGKIEFYSEGWEFRDWKCKIKWSDFLKKEKELKEKKEKDKKIEQERIEKLTKKAKETGEKQIAHKWSEACNDPNEECNIDQVREVILPSGEKKIERNHTW